jgi:hypothetical protein
MVLGFFGHLLPSPWQVTCERSQHGLVRWLAMWSKALDLRYHERLDVYKDLR